MKTIRTILILTALTISTTVFGQTETEIAEKPFIEINGNAELEIIPNEIFIGIVIQEKYVNKEKVTIQMQEEKLKTSLKEIGVDIKDLYLSDANADYVKVKFRTKDVLTKKNFILKVSNATIAGKVFQQLDKLEIIDASIAKVSHSKIDSLKKEIRIMAIKAAKAKADYLLAAIGEQTGKPLIVREEGTYTSDRPMPSNSNTRFIDSDERKAGNEDIQFQKIKIRSEIYVKFLIK